MNEERIMSRYWDDFSVYSQPETSELKKNARESKKRAEEKGRILHPISVKTRAIVKTWWGKAWCENLERYADYANRIERGKRYVRTGTVIDLNIESGKVLAKVQGSRKTPYNVSIRISPLSEEKCQSIMRRCGRKLENLQALLRGDFPADMQELFRGKDGLFPNPREISLDCSCPDRAIMCKHIAAVLYGVGVRLDENSVLFFTLRGIDVERFVDTTLGNRVEQMLVGFEDVRKKSRRIIEEDALKDLFGDLL